MRNQDELGFQIDPETYTRPKATHSVLITFFVLIILGVLAAAVWFLGFSEWGFAWSGNEAKIETETPTDVVTSYPEVRLTLNKVALILESGTKAKVKAKVTRTSKSADIDLTDLILHWHSENPSVAIVNQRGQVTAVSEGTARIMVTVGNTNVNSNSVSCIVTVRPTHPIEAPKDSTVTSTKP